MRELLCFRPPAFTYHIHYSGNRIINNEYIDLCKIVLFLKTDRLDYHNNARDDSGFDTVFFFFFLFIEISEVELDNYKIVRRHVIIIIEYKYTTAIC